MLARLLGSELQPMPSQLSTQLFLAPGGPCWGERGNIRFSRTPIAQAASGAATNAKGTQSDARNTDPGSRPFRARSRW